MSVKVHFRKDIARIFLELSYMSQMAKENHFKSQSYRNAASALEQMTDEKFDNIENFTVEEGIGKGIASKIQEIMNTGTCNKYEELYPTYGEALVLTKIHGVGGKIALDLWKKGARNITDVKRMIETGELKNKRIAEGIKHYKEDEVRLYYAEARAIADRLVKKIRNIYKDKINLIWFCGSLRRKNKTIGDLDIIIEKMDDDLELDGEEILHSVSEYGSEKISGHYESMPVDIRIANTNNFGAMLLYFTGSKQFNIDMRIKAVKLGYFLNEYGLWNGEERIAGKKEEAIFEALNLAYIKPENRISGEYSI